MNGRFLAVASALSLLLCAATVVLWIRSYRMWDDLNLQRHIQRDEHATSRSRGLVLTSDRGTIEFYCYVVQFDVEDAEYEGPPPMFLHGPAIVRWQRPRRTIWNQLGFESYASSGRVVALPASEDERAWWAPHWVFVLLFAALPTAHTLARRHAVYRRRRGLLLCPACGYDLRASPNRCPECGTVSEAARTRI